MGQVCPNRLYAATPVPLGAAALYSGAVLTRLLLTDVRNHAALTLDPAPGFVVLTGENGAGKTNVLEAVSLLAPGRGLRRAPLSAVARQGGPGGFAIAATHLPALRLAPLPLAGGAGGGVVDPIATSAGPPPIPPASGRGEEGAVRIGAGTLAAAPERRVVRINGAPAASTALAEWLTILWVTPAMDRLFTGAAGERRAFLDRLTLALAPAHAGHAARYEAAVRARNRLLADPARSDPEWLSALEAQLAEHGAAIDAARRATVGALGERLGAIAPGPFARAALALEGWSGDGAALAAALRSGRARDAAAGRTLAGPHRTDLVVTHADKQQPAAHCSTGEQKALLLGLVLAHAALVAERSGRAPILLLDEVAAHLDPLRRAALFERLAGQGQVWMTGTEPALFAGLPEETSWHRLGG